MPIAVLADDEPLMRAALREQLAMLWPELEIRAEAEDGPGALRIVESLRPDVAFLDIRMPGMTGLDVARAMTVPSRVVFVTAFDAHALAAFEANAVDYMLKPLEPARLARTVAKLRRSLEAQAAGAAPSVADMVAALARTGIALPAAGPGAWEAQESTRHPLNSASRLEWLQVAVGQQIRMLHLDDVMYFESDTKYTRVVADECDGLIRLPLKELIESCEIAAPGRFLQTHRSTVVNRRFIHSVHRKGEAVELELKGRAERLKVSVSNHHLFRAM